ncbi:MAG: hypothetical protein ACI8X5_000645 [Planctomycetota bacterium]|jgi:hypothetical protein
MTQSSRSLIVLCLSLLALACQSSAVSDSPSAVEESGASQSFEEHVAGLEHQEGLFDLWLDRSGGRVWLGLGGAESAPLDAPAGWLAECLYVEGLATGLGSNDVGLDRGQLGETRLVFFRQLGERVFIEAPNLAFRARSTDANERRAARESFASSVLWSGEVTARSASGKVLVDITSFIVRDAHGSARSLQVDGGSWRLDLERSFLEPDSTLAFVDNIELEARLTFAGESAGREVREVAPDSSSVSLVQHHSFVRLPDDQYEPRAWDPRSGSFSTGFIDVAAAPAEPNQIRFAVRHRMRKVDPNLALSEAVEPIVYYVDRGAPEPIRSALIEGASWWNQAFEAAGYKDGFRVELLPEGVHPLDVRYNVIEWVHRSSRGWSYGTGVSDPRTGEMIKGHVVLGSLRVRQDRMIIEGLIGTELSGSGQANDPVEVALARIRQLAAHEVGHTLGLAHNFAASTYDGRASVMDYPAPRVRLAGGQGTLDMSDAYTREIGSWDLFTVSHLYADCADGLEESSFLEGLRIAAESQGMLYLSDADTRPSGASDPRANLWDNGSDPLVELEHLLKVRRVALQNFAVDRLATGESTALYEEVLIPLFLMHRYQVVAVSKMIGGQMYEHSLVGDGRDTPTVVSAERQRAALRGLLTTLQRTHNLPDPIADLLAPRTMVAGRRREQFSGRTAPAFDRNGLAQASLRHTVRAMLDPTRLERVLEQHDYDPAQLGLAELLEALVRDGFEGQGAGAGQNSPRRSSGALAGVVADELLLLASNPRASQRVRDESEAALVLAHGRTPDAWLRKRIVRFLERGFDSELRDTPPHSMPPGSPIGCSQATSSP